jgi:AraC family transcriptional regulator
MVDDEPGRPEWAALEVVHDLAGAEVALVSPENDWDVIAATRFLLRNIDVTLPALGVPAFGVNYGPNMQLERTLHGKKVSGCGAAGHLSLLPPDADTRWVFNKPGDIVLVFLNRRLFNHAIEESPNRDAKFVDIVPQFVIRDLVLERIAHQLLKEISEPSPGSRLSTDTLAQELAAHLIGTHSNLDHLQQGQRPYTIAPTKLKRAEEFILANLSIEMSLQDIANATGMSLFHFAKAFKHSTNQSPYQYVKEQRLRHARALLHDGSMSIGEVAKAVGFSHSYFTAVFARHMGMTPSKFRDVLRS